MFRAAKIALSLVLVVGAATVISACGEDRSNLLPGKNVNEISANLDTVQQLVDEGKCFEALNAANAVQSQAEALPASVDPKLKRSLLDGVVTLTILVGKQCEDDPSLGTTGTTGTTDTIEPDTEVTPTGPTGVTSEDDETGTTGKKNNQSTDESTKPSKPKPTPTPTPKPKPNPNPDPGPVTPTNPTTPGGETPSGPGSGGISPNQ